jgi:hypothetical protein
MGLMIREYVKRDARGKSRKIQVSVEGSNSSRRAIAKGFFAEEPKWREKMLRWRDKSLEPSERDASNPPVTRT